ncbi:MAG: hypothetical protein RIE59_07285 [Imperialibacter sp.]
MELDELSMGGKMTCHFPTDPLANFLKFDLLHKVKLSRAHGLLIFVRIKVEKDGLFQPEVFNFPHISKPSPKEQLGVLKPHCAVYE